MIKHSILYGKCPQINNLIFDKFNLQKEVRIFHLSDLHLETWYKNNNYFKNLFLQYDFDLIILNGDIFDNYNYNLTLMKKLLNDFVCDKFKNKVYFVPGNHESYGGISKEVNLLALQDFGLKLLDVNGLYINGLKIEGITDFHFNKALFLSDIEKSNNDNVDKIIFCHNPIIQKYSNLLNKQIIISGHTHGGQIFPFGLVVLEKELNKKYFDFNLRGHKKYFNTDTFVSNGSGYSKLSKFRIFAKNTIDYIIIK